MGRAWNDGAYGKGAAALSKGSTKETRMATSSHSCASGTGPGRSQGRGPEWAGNWSQARLLTASFGASTRFEGRDTDWPVWDLHMLSFDLLWVVFASFYCIFIVRKSRSKKKEKENWCHDQGSCDIPPHLASSRAVCTSLYYQPYSTFTKHLALFRVLSQSRAHWL